ncbi:MAG: DUF4440 domain-containing protein [Pyrinomonadaceae bacterium]
MKSIIIFLICTIFAWPSIGQTAELAIYETERAFQAFAARRGIRQAFIEFLSPTGVMFLPDAVNGRETWRARPESPAALTWNPVWIDASANGVLAYSIGNSEYRAKGKDDPTVFYGHYISVWTRQPNGEYRAALDTGINHEKPSITPTDWKSPPRSANRVERAPISAGDFAVNFYIAAERRNMSAAYAPFVAEDAIFLREGRQPIVGRKAVIDFLKNTKSRVVFAKRKAFIEAPDLAYVNSTYRLTEHSGKETERGNYVQVWKLIEGKWKIAADVFVPLPKS